VVTRLAALCMTFTLTLALAFACGATSTMVAARTARTFAFGALPLSTLSLRTAVAATRTRCPGKGIISFGLDRGGLDFGFCRCFACGNSGFQLGRLAGCLLFFPLRARFRLQNAFLFGQRQVRIDRLGLDRGDFGHGAGFFTLGFLGAIAQTTHQGSE